jgi:hypothetical protein
MAAKIGARTKAAAARSAPTNIDFPGAEMGAFSQRFYSFIVANEVIDSFAPSLSFQPWATGAAVKRMRRHRFHHSEMKS